MSRIDFEPWEPEESVGKLWHAIASRFDAPEAYDGARVGLSEVGGRLAVLFRALGGASSVEMKPVAEEVSRHRLSFLRRLGTEAEAIPRASFDGAALRLPASLALFPAREANAAAYIWIAAIAAHAPATQERPEDALQADLQQLAAANRMVRDTLADAPGFRALYADLCAATLATRPTPSLPATEAALEALIRAELGDPAPLPDEARAMREMLISGIFPPPAPRAVINPSARSRSGPICAWPGVPPIPRSRPVPLKARPKRAKATPCTAPSGARPIRSSARTASSCTSSKQF